jgi:uncharacterized protein YyaL (SSP411 family)
MFSKRKFSYLLQHDNPVVGLWGPEALEKSKNENKPIFWYRLCSLSLVPCHGARVWDEAVNFMNEHFEH